jgi:hypothetical protein
MLPAIEKMHFVSARALLFPVIDPCLGKQRVWAMEQSVREADVPDALPGLGEPGFELRQVSRAEVAQHVPFDVRPDEFNRIQFRCIRREILHRQSCFTFHEGAERLRFMDASVIEQNGDLARDVAKHVLHEGEHLWPSNRTGMGLLQQLSPGGDRPDGGELVPARLDRQDRCLATGRPRAGHCGLQTEAHFIGEDERFPSVNLFFPTRGRERSPKSLRPLPSVPSPGGLVSVGRIPTGAISD